MKKIALLAMLMFACVSMMAGGYVPKGYKLVWKDEFKGQELSPDWTIIEKPAGWVNHELQNYVREDPEGISPLQVYYGTLKISAYRANDGKIYSGRINACRQTGWQYGYMEARIKLPTGKGTWPAFWMMPVEGGRWPACGEIDIMEEIGGDPNMIHSTIHTRKYNNTGTPIENGHRIVEGAEGNFHVYGMEWTAEHMLFYVDGEQLLEYKNEGTVDAWPFDKPFYIILNLAWGGDWGGSRGVDDEALPITMEVDYVRVYQKKQ